MVLFFRNASSLIYSVHAKDKLNSSDIEKLTWLFDNSVFIDQSQVDGIFVGPRKEMITPWSTNAVEITQNMGIPRIKRIEEYKQEKSHDIKYDHMLQALYNDLTQDVFTINRKPELLKFIEDIKSYNLSEGLALSSEEINYLEQLSKRLNRKLTDCEVFGFSQVNSEHCRHKIFNGKFIIDGLEMPMSLFELIKKTSNVNKNLLVSAYKDNCAFIAGPVIEQFAPLTQDKPDYFVVKEISTVLSLKAETHNFPTTVEPFNGAATGTGGEIRDRIAGGKGGIVLAGTAVYMASYPRLTNDRLWEHKTQPRKWLYQTPSEILIKASNGASDFGNKFGQPLICGSLLTFESFTQKKKYGYDKVIMLAGGVGFARQQDSLKDLPVKNQNIVVLGGDNYRIGMGGGAVSSVATGEYNNSIELNAVQRSNPEMQKRVYNAVRAMTEADINPIVSIHDHGAGGHLNCFSELVEATGGTIHIDKLPIGDPTLSPKEIIGNESQERMGLVISEKDTDLLRKVAERERAPIYIAGVTTDDNKFIVELKEPLTHDEQRIVDLKVEDMFGNPPKTILNDNTIENKFEPLDYKLRDLEEYLEDMLQLEAVACKDWLTNKVDRSVTGKVAMQQCTGRIQLPLNDMAVMALDYKGKSGIATSLGHAPVAGLIDPVAGSILSIAEALTNIVWAPLRDGIRGISLSANWMWPCKNKGEDASLYKAVEAVSNFAIELGINIPTGKDSLSMTQKYPDGNLVLSPGTVIITAAAEVTDIRKTISPALNADTDTQLIYIDFSKDNFKLGGSAFSQIRNKLQAPAPKVNDTSYFVKAFNTIQYLISEGKILAGHDISAGGMITTLLEMTFTDNEKGLKIDLSGFEEKDLIKILFSENPGIIIQVKDMDFVTGFLKENGIKNIVIGHPVKEWYLNISRDGTELYKMYIKAYRDVWYKTSYLFDINQCGENLALERYNNYDKQPLDFKFPNDFSGKLSQYNLNGKRTTNNKQLIKAAIIREKGVNGDREMAYAMYLAGFDVKDVHMTDLITGRETLEDIKFIVFVGGFSNSDVLGSAKGWAGAFLYNEKAKTAIDNFYKRKDTLSLGVCNGCQLMAELGLIYPEHENKPRLMHNDSGKFESSFLQVEVLPNESVMLKSLAGAKLGIWVAHGEGNFFLPYEESKYNIPVKYFYKEYPGTPNGSDFSTAAIVSADGRHLAIMPHLERAFLPWQWAYYPEGRKIDEVSPWIEAFVNARAWVEKSI